MIVKELVDQWAEVTDEVRADIGSKLMGKFSPVSISTLRDFQLSWDGRRPFSEFLFEQAKELKACVEWELSVLGDTVREITGVMDALFWELELG